ncbi:MAG: collagen-like protein [Prosthecobacter sp.]|jgi:hypothetical protein|uniref:collagen-like triple helix repeat-containing protein n=1 Tax=Prosthecobacter sp. TaxID=1965333 RepID=UPI0019DB67AD|nr:hypothetical protein [Prosthecobacter sp.]MBE2283893.1 collagen-like protein [Prosthecobacter sp.]
MFDPAQPAEASDLSSAVMRSQLTSLKALIDAIITVTDAQVDGVSTVNPGDPALAQVSVVDHTLHFTFALPRGQNGAEGPPGQNGSDGAAGPEGPQGPPFAQAIVDDVTTLDPGEPASASVSFDGSYVRFTFSIPRGNDGNNGADGSPGEVSQSTLDAAMAATALNPAGVSPLSLTFSDPPTATELSQVQDKFNELLTALQRP